MTLFIVSRCNDMLCSVERERSGKDMATQFEELKETEQPQPLEVEELDRLEAIAGIQRGLEAVEAGHTRPVNEFLAELREEFGFSESR
jgi:hypothetical protein